MTPAQMLELEQLDAAVAAAPDDLSAYSAYFARARFVAEQGGDFARIVADCRAIQKIWANEESAQKERFRLLNGNARTAWRAAKTRNTATSWLGTFERARAVALFGMWLETDPNLASWRAQRAEQWDALGLLEEAAALDFGNLPPNWKLGTFCDWQVWAMALSVARGYVSGAWAQAQAIRVGLRGHHRRIPAPWYARRARRTNQEDYEQLAWWDLAVECESDNPKWHAARGRFLSDQGFERAAREAYTRAIELAPDEPYFYEARAKTHQGRTSNPPYWDLETGMAGDYARALELRVAAGQLSGAPAALAAQGDRLRAAKTHYFRRQARAYAFYSLALGARPGAPLWHLRRAQVLLLPYGNYLPPPGHAALGREFRCAHEDFVRALALEPSLDEARAGIVTFLRLSLPRPSQHEQIEALLGARQELIDAGLAPDLAGAIVAEVAAKLGT